MKYLKLPQISINGVDYTEHLRGKQVVAGQPIFIASSVTTPDTNYTTVLKTPNNTTYNNFDCGVYNGIKYENGEKVLYNIQQSSINFDIVDGNLYLDNELFEDSGKWQFLSKAANNDKTIPIYGIKTNGKMYKLDGINKTIVEPSWNFIGFASWNWIGKSGGYTVYTCLGISGETHKVNPYKYDIFVWGKYDDYLFAVDSTTDTVYTISDANANHIEYFTNNNVNNLISFTQINSTEKYCAVTMVNSDDNGLVRNEIVRCTGVSSAGFDSIKLIYDSTNFKSSNGYYGYKGPYPFYILNGYLCKHGGTCITVDTNKTKPSTAIHSTKGWTHLSCGNYGYAVLNNTNLYQIYTNTSTSTNLSLITTEYTWKEIYCTENESFGITSDNELYKFDDQSLTKIMDADGLVEIIKTINSGKNVRNTFSEITLSKEFLQDLIQ